MLSPIKNELLQPLSKLRAYTARHYRRRRAGRLGLVAAVARSGRASEVLGGPLYYCVVILAAVLFGWTKSSVALVAVCQMAAGDGFADIIGRR